MISYVYLCGLYLWTDDSPASKVHNVNLFYILQKDIFDYEQLDRVLLPGDFNARIGLNMR